MHRKHRVFVAINLPQDVKKQLSKLEEKWSELPARWTAKENLHITLIFLGYLTDEEVGEVCIAVKEVSKKHKAFSITLNKIAYGPTSKIPPRYIWVGGERIKELSIFKKDLEELLLEKINFRPENRAFNPHITLARIGAFQWRQINSEERPEINENINLTFSVESIEVMESKLKRRGPEYIFLESFDLNT